MAATVGTTTLYLSGLRPWTQFSSSWLMWWAGDGIGVLLFAPLILTIFGNEKYIGRRKPVSEIVILALCTSLACVLIFEDRFFSRTVNDVLAFTLFPFVMWSAIRFGLLGTSLLSSAIAMATVWETARGHGPFVESSHLANAALLQVFLAVISVTGMVLAAVVRERETAEELLAREQELIRERDRAEAALLRNEKLIATSRLAATMAHEINNPLAAVTNLLYLIGNETDLSERSRHYLELAEDELQRVAHSARRTLGFYREVATPERVDLSQLLGEVVEVFKKQISEKQIRIVRKCYAVTVSCNRGEIFQVFSNLIANAVDALFKGGTLQLRVCRQRASHAEIARVCVADNGSGIARQHHENIFQPFFTTKKDLGTGLGMWAQP